MVKRRWKHLGLNSSTVRSTIVKWKGIKEKNISCKNVEETNHNLDEILKSPIAQD